MAFFSNQCEQNVEETEEMNSIGQEVASAGPGSSSAMSSQDGGNDIQIQDTSFTMYDLGRRAEAMVERINARRASDQEIIEKFKKDLVEKVTKTCLMMQENMHTIYEVNSKEMEQQLMELSEVLVRCNHLNDELKEAMKVVASLNMDQSMIQ